MSTGWRCRATGANCSPEHAGRQDRREPTRCAEREQRPDEEQAFGVADHTTCLRVDDDHAGPDQPAEEHDDVARDPLREHERRVQPQGKDHDRNWVFDMSLRLEYDVLREVYDREEKRDQ